MSLGERVKHFRTRLGLTLEQLGELSDVDLGTIAALEIRKSQRSKFASQLAKGLGLTLDQLLDPNFTGDSATPPYTQPAAAPVPLRVKNNKGTYTTFPFPDIDPDAISRLEKSQLDQLQGALLLTAAQLGIDIRKRRAA